jgi:glutamyl-tRNA reductase
MSHDPAYAEKATPEEIAQALLRGYRRLSEERKILRATRYNLDDLWETIDDDEGRAPIEAQIDVVAAAIKEACKKLSKHMKQMRRTPYFRALKKALEAKESEALVIQDKGLMASDEERERLSCLKNEIRATIAELEAFLPGSTHDPLFV